MKGNYPELSKTTIYGNRVLVELEVIETNLILHGGSSEKGTLTHKAYILAVGTSCNPDVANLKQGDKVQLDWSVDLQPTIDVSNTSKPNLRANPNCRLFTFRNPSKDDQYKKYPTALVYDFEILAKVDD